MSGSMIVRNAVFGVRNADKTLDGHIGRSTVCIGQAKNVFDAVKGLDCKLGNSAVEASKALHKACESDVLVKGLYKTSDFCSKHINPLIWASAGIDILLADNKKDALVQNVSAIGTMRIAEELMKKNNNLDNFIDKGFNKIKSTKAYGKIATSKPVQTVSKKLGTIVTKSNSKLLKNITKGGVPALVKGLAFVAGSCMAYDAGRKLGDLLLEKSKVPPTSIVQSPQNQIRNC